MTIGPTNEDCVRLQQYGNTLQDGVKAGTIYGPLSDAPDLLKIGAEQQQAQFRIMDEQLQARMRATSQPITGGSYRLPRSRGEKIFLRLLAMIVAAPFALVAAILATGILTAPDTTALNRDALLSSGPDAAFYAPTDPRVQALARNPTTTLLGTYFSTGDWTRREFNEDQRAAAHAIWLRYLRDPEAFLGMRAHDQGRTLHVLDRYLFAMGKETNHPQPFIDRGRLYLSGLRPNNLQYTTRARLSETAWFEGSLALPGNAELASLAESGNLNRDLHRSFIRGWMLWKAKLPVSLVLAIENKIA